jgi:hypothetical protein
LPVVLGVLFGCGASVTLAPLDDVCGGTTLTAREVLAQAKPSYSATLTYGSDAGPPTALTLTTDYDGGTITCKRGMQAPAGSEIADSAPSISVAVHATFTTSDGAFAEGLAATLTSTGPSVGPAAFFASLSADALRGTYRSIAGEPNTTLTFDGALTKSASSGNVMVATVISPTITRGNPFGAAWS